MNYEWRARTALRMCWLALPAAAWAGESMPVVTQNALVAKYCAECHMDRNSSGGVSFERFDAAQAPPSLLAMMLSKLTGGVALSSVLASEEDPAAAALVNRKSKTGAMGAAGIPRPDTSTFAALVHAFAVESKGATEWSVERNASGVTASALREISMGGPGEARAYRLVISCNTARSGLAEVAWSPLPESGIVSVSVDGGAPLRFKVQPRATKVDGVEFDTGYPAVVISNGLRLPADSLTVADLFPGERISFAFSGLPADARRELSACY